MTVEPHPHDGAQEPSWSATLETAKAIRDGARDVLEDEKQRTATLDGKLSQLAAFSGLSISISGAVGGSVVATGRLPLGFAIALGTVLAVAGALLLSGVGVAFWGLSPKLYAGVSVAAAGTRVSPKRFASPPNEELARLARTDFVLLRTARDVNKTKVGRTSFAYKLVGAGFGFVVLALLVTVVGSVTSL